MTFPRALAPCPLEPLLAGRANNVDVLRLAAAAMVLLFHSMALNLRFQDDVLFQVLPAHDLGSLGVGVFFFVSGLLVTRSYARRASLRSFALARVLRSSGAFAAAMLLLLGVLFVAPPAAVLAFNRPPNFPLFLFFALGMAATMLARWIRLSLPVAVGLVALVCAWPVASATLWIYCPVVAYAALVLAYHPACRLPDFLRDHDYSYGLYVYAFPIQQSLLFFGGPALHRPRVLFAAAFPLTLVVAALSWHLVERRALALKDRLARPRSTLTREPHDPASRMSDLPDPNPSSQPRPRLWRGLLLSLGVVAILAGAEFYALRTSGRLSPPPPPPPPPPAATAAAPATLTRTIPPPVAAPMPIVPGLPRPASFGALDTPAGETIVADRSTLAGWAADPAGIKAVEARIGGVAFPATLGGARADVAAALPDIPGAATSGYTLDLDFSTLTLQRHELTVVAINNRGETTVVARRSVVRPAAMALWSPLLDAHPSLADRRFTFLMATSGVALGAAQGIRARYDGLLSRTMRVGMSVPILYLRTTKGAAGDWAFDPAFDLARKCGNRLVVEDNLDGVIAFAISTSTPVNFILNGGIWADASCESAEWDLMTHLETDDANVQWDQDDKTFPGDYRKGLAGSTESPRLSRVQTYNVYNRTLRDYKRRNLQAAARIIARFAREHPDLFVGVNLDADTYKKPFIAGHRHDYNPATLRQFRDWLQGTGAYAGTGGAGVPDLRSYRRAKPLSLADVNRLARKQWTAWAQVQPPREFPGDDNQPVPAGKTPFWDDPWYQEWDMFRRQVVALHYTELAQWTHEAGVPADRIFTAQAFTAPDPGLRAQSTSLGDRSPDYDGAGVSIEGAVPRVGHLGTIVYGIAAENAYTLDSGHGLFATIARYDPQWAIVESNATDLKHPAELPPYARSYRQFRDFFNYGGRQIALMAWNGSNGLYAGFPGYLPYTSWLNTQAEQAMMDFLVSHADVPASSLLWTFGSAAHADDDGWTAQRGALETSTHGLLLAPFADRVRMRSPGDQVIRPATIKSLHLRFDGARVPQYVTVAARTGAQAQWRVVGQAAGTAVALDWPREWLDGRTIVEQIELELHFPPGAGKPNLTRVLLFPATASGS